MKRIRKTIVAGLVAACLTLFFALPALAASWNTSVNVAPDCSSAAASGSATAGAGEIVRVETEAEIGGVSYAFGMGGGSTAGTAFASVTLDEANAGSAAAGTTAFGTAVATLIGGTPTGSCHATVRVYVNGLLVYSESACGGPTCLTKAEALPSALWLANVCQPYDNGAFNENDQITFGTDDGNTLLVGSSYDGPWTEVASGGTTWVLTKTQLEELVTSQGVESYGDLWFVVKGPNGYSEPRLLRSMITDRIGMWGEDCQPVP